MTITSCVVILGESGAGKTTVANILEKDYGYETISPIGDLKEFCEQHFELPKGSLETYEGKSVIPEGASRSVGDMLVDSFHFWATRDLLFSCRYFLRTLKERKEDVSPHKICCASVRNLSELNAIVETSRFALVQVTRHTSESKSPDIHLLDLLQIAKEKADCWKLLENNDDISLGTINVALADWLATM